MISKKTRYWGKNHEILYLPQILMKINGPKCDNRTKNIIEKASLSNSSPPIIDKSWWVSHGGIWRILIPRHYSDTVSKSDLRLPNNSLNQNLRISWYGSFPDILFSRRKLVTWTLLIGTLEKWENSFFLSFKISKSDLYFFLFYVFRWNDQKIQPMN